MSDQFTPKGATKFVVGIFCCRLLSKFDLGVSSSCGTSAFSPPLPVAGNGIFSIACHRSLFSFEYAPQTLQSGRKSMHVVGTLRLD